MKTRFMTAKQLSAMLEIPEGTLRYWRNIGIGPTWYKFEGTIRYALEDVESYLNSTRRIPSVRPFMEACSGSL